MSSRRYFFTALSLTACNAILGTSDLVLRDSVDAGGNTIEDAQSPVDANVAADVGTDVVVVPVEDAGDAEPAIDSAADSSDSATNVCLAAGCDPRATCTNSDAGIVCKCPAGYATPDDGRTCSDIDECISTTLCGTGTCQNLPGSYSCNCGGGSCQVVFGSQGNYTFRVPTGVASIRVDLWGGGGGASTVNVVPGAAGGYTNGSIAVLAGTTFDILVGGGGAAGINGGNTNNAFGGGGIGANYGGGGGGRSEIGIGTTPYLVAGGGGGAGYAGGLTTGAGGGLMGGNATGCGGGDGQGGSQNAGGIGGPGSTPAGPGVGGNATFGNGGGGGGGYFGGGAGGGNGVICGGAAGGGGGGSGFIRPITAVSGTTIAGSGPTPAGTGDPRYDGNAGRGGNGPQYSNPTRPGIDGRVVISWQ